MAWAELVFISLVTPNASFLGHLAGILAGLAHLTLFDRGPAASAGGFLARLGRRLRRLFTFRRSYSGVRLLWTFLQLPLCRNSDGVSTTGRPAAISRPAWAGGCDSCSLFRRSYSGVRLLYGSCQFLLFARSKLVDHWPAAAGGGGSCFADPTPGRDLLDVCRAHRSAGQVPFCLLLYLIQAPLHTC